MRWQRNRLLAGSAILLSAGLFAACSPGSDSPLSPSKSGKVTTFTTPSTVSSTMWDFAGILIPGTAGPVDLGTEETISQSGFGSIVARSSAGTHVTVKGGDLAVGASERGLGLCIPGTATTCSFPDDGDEIGDGGPGALDLDFSGVLPAGSVLTSIDLGSVQPGEGYRYSISTDGGASFGPVQEAFGGDAEDNATITFDNLPTTGLVVRLEKTVELNGECTSSCHNDYTVRAATTSVITNEELLNGRMT
ncbi:MAG TPA: hypothetical protein VFL95_08915, partial [Gemmatimonadales bacterium]|nr:hypothetical protein [Gemmatimonadales bacterium]